jgi:hypothetical protein
MDGIDALATTRSGSVLEQVAIGSTQPAYCGWRTARYLYVQYDVGEGAEIYDYKKDPAELVNRINRDKYSERIAGFKAKSQEACSPTPPGFDWS